MSSTGSGAGTNVYLFSGKDATPVNVSQGGNQGSQLYFDSVLNIGRLILRTGKVTRLQDIPCSMIMVSNPEGQGNIWYAGYDTNAPQVGVGLPIAEGTSVSIPCTDANQVSFVPEHDGDSIYIIVLASGNTSTVTPSNPPAFTDTPPTLSYYNPAINNAPAVATNQIISVASSAPLDPTTVNSTTITQSGASSIVATISLDSDDPTKILVIPTTAMATSTTYHLMFGPGISDLNGNATTAGFPLVFTTVPTPTPPDTTPPTVIVSNPAPFSTNNVTSITPSITFSEPINLASVNNNNVTAFIADNDQQILNLNFSLSTDYKTLSIQNMPLNQSVNYQINIVGGTTGLTDLAGNHFASTFVIPFATAAPPGNVFYNVSGNSYDSLQPGVGWVETGILMWESRSKLIGQIPVIYTFILRKVGLPTGNVTFAWERSNEGGRDGTYFDFRVLGSIAASTLSTSDQVVTLYDTANTSQIQFNDFISVRYKSGGNSSNYVQVKVSNYDAFDGTNTENGKIDYRDNGINFDTVDVAGTITVVNQ